jgi:protein SCO1
MPLTRRELLAAAAALSSCARRQQLPVFNTVPPFVLTAQNGLPFDSKRLAGAPWLASFFFTSCNGPCPRMNVAIRNVQEETYPFQGLKIVSFSVDPERDTPEVLAAYAKRYKADPDRWFFLTGPRATLSALSKDAFLAGELDMAQSHSTRIMLVDARGRVRGHYQAMEKEGIDALKDGISNLYEEGI